MDNVFLLVVKVEVVAGNGTSIGTRATSETNSRDERPGTCQYDLALDDVLGCPAVPWAASLRGETGGCGGRSTRACGAVRLTVAAAGWEWISR